jgi:prepilin-type N-terminal cleavage/methylation domain-containing protein
MAIQRTRTNRAFTLVEILVVVVILGIISTLVIPQLSNASDLRAAAAARVVLADLTYAQNCAITTQKTHFVKFSPGANTDTYSLLDQMSPSQNILTHPVTQMAFTQLLGPGAPGAMANARFGTITIGLSTETTPTLAFDSLGTPYVYTSADGLTALSDPAAIEVVCNGYAIRINIEPYTGELSATAVNP